MTTTQGKYTKAKLKAPDADGVKELECIFNPKDYSISTGSTWADKKTRGAKKSPPSQFIGTNPRSLSLSLLLDDWATDKGSVQKAVDTLFEWTCPTKKSRSKDKPNPPVCQFQWGKTVSFKAYLKSVNATFTLFHPNGTPARATVKITLDEVPEETKGQNPTSGSLTGNRVVVLGPGDSLHSVAYDEYGKPAYWRALARANEIDDPLRIPAGTALLVPTATEAADLL